MVTYVIDNNPLGTQKTVSLDFKKELAYEDRQGNFKILKLITFSRRYMAEILPILCKNTIKSINQSINA